MTEINFALLPDLPQSRRLAALVADLWADPNVVALWLGGSLARGEADRYSDVDLHVALRPEAYDPDAIPESAERLVAAAVVRLRFSFGIGTTLWHMLLEDGEIYDLSLQPMTQEPAFEARLVLACRDEAFGAKLIGGEDRSVDFPPAVPGDLARAIAGLLDQPAEGPKGASPRHAVAGLARRISHATRPDPFLVCVGNRKRLWAA